MRLYNIYYICKQCINIISQLEFVHGKSGHFDENLKRVKDWDIYIDALIALKQVDALSEELNDFYDTLMKYHFTDDIYDSPWIYTVSEETELEKKMTLLVQKMKTIIDLYESIDDSEVGSNIVSERGIDVKIPTCESLGEYISYLEEIDFIFTQYPFLKYENAKLEFKKVDVGSQWLTFIITGAVGTASVTYILKNIALLIDIAIQVKSHLLNLKQQEELLRKQKIQNDILEFEQEKHKQLAQRCFDMAIEEIQRKNKDILLKDGEERGKVEKSIKKLCRLLGKSVEFYASINVGNKIQLLFPPLQDQAKLPNNIIKYIEEMGTYGNNEV